MATRNEIIVNVHPGRVLKRELQARGIKQKDFAAEIGMQPTHLSALLNGKRSVSNETASRLERSLGIDAYFWLNLQAKYDYDVAMGKEGAIQAAGAAIGADRDKAWEEYYAHILHDARKSAGLTQRQLAERSGTDKEYISRLERGLSIPTVSTLSRIAAAMGLAVVLRPAAAL